MADPGLARRYCAICGSLASEPQAQCPRCAQLEAVVPRTAPAPYAPPARPAYVERGGGPPGWVVLLLLLLIAVVTIVVVLGVDGEFSSSVTWVPALVGTSAARLGALASL